MRGVALEVLAHMGLLDAARAMTTQMKGFSTVDAAGRELWGDTARSGLVAQISVAL